MEKQQLKTKLNFARRVEALFRDCLFRNEAEAKKFKPVLSLGIITNVGFHPERLAGHADTIKALIKEVVKEEFYEDTDGGYSFLLLPIDRNENQWGEQRNAEQLFLLAQALNLASFCLPREVWPMLPGGMPYVVFKR